MVKRNFWSRLLLLPVSEDESFPNNLNVKVNAIDNVAANNNVASITDVTHNSMNDVASISSPNFVSTNATTDDTHGVTQNNIGDGVNDFTSDGILKESEKTSYVTPESIEQLRMEYEEKLQSAKEDVDKYFEYAQNSHIHQRTLQNALEKIRSDYELEVSKRLKRENYNRKSESFDKDDNIYVQSKHNHSRRKDRKLRNRQDTEYGNEEYSSRTYTPNRHYSRRLEKERRRVSSFPSI